MEAIAYALYFNTHGKKHYGDWRIFTPSFAYAPTVHSGLPDPWQSLRNLLASGRCTQLSMPEPQVFKCGVISTDQNQLIYRFEFYECFVVNAWTLFRTLVTF